MELTSSEEIWDEIVSFLYSYFKDWAKIDGVDYVPFGDIESWESCRYDFEREILKPIRDEIREKEVKPLDEQKKIAYQERDKLVALLSSIYPSHLCRHPDDDEEWDDDWHWIVCIHSPEGQLTFHIHDSELGLFQHLERRENHWDGHDTEEKYQRIKKIVDKLPIRFSNSEEEICLTQIEIDELLEYSCSLPTGKTIGKRWKKYIVGGWLMGEYTKSTDPNYVNIVWRRIKKSVL